MAIYRTLYYTDVGSVLGGRLRLAGQVTGAEPRGCSMAMDDLMAASQTSR